MVRSEPNVLHPMESFGSVSGLAEGLRINRLEDRLTPLVPFPHKHDFYQLIFVEAGKGQHQIDFENYPVRKGSTFIMQPAEVHSWFLSGDTRGFVIEFNRQTFQSKDLRWQQIQSILNILPSNPKLSPKLFGKIGSICQEAYSEFTGRTLHFELLLLAKLISVLLLIHRENPAPISEPNSPLYESFLQLLEQHFRQEHSVRFYSEHLGLTSKALTMRFHRLGVSPPRALIQDRCLIEAKRFLVYSSLTIQEIADRLGFDDPNYFARFFRAQTKISPGAFRSLTGRLC